MEEVSCKKNQYGGVKGSSVSHLLIDVWNEIMRNLEDDRASTLLTSIDYAKAFNRLSFQWCLEAFARKGASTQVVRLLATFLSNRSMSVRVNQSWSPPRPVHGGVPQGSILGVFLFNVSTDDLEDEDESEFVPVDGHKETVTSDESESGLDALEGGQEQERDDVTLDGSVQSGDPDRESGDELLHGNSNDDFYRVTALSANILYLDSLGTEGVNLRGCMFYMLSLIHI